MEREWRVALDAASVAHGIRCGIRGTDLKRLAQEEVSLLPNIRSQIVQHTSCCTCLLNSYRLFIL
jgi:hypothetical protein